MKDSKNCKSKTTNKVTLITIFKIKWTLGTFQLKTI